MDAWYKARNYVVMIEHKKNRLQLAILKVEIRINQLTVELKCLRAEYAELNKRIDSLTPLGVLVRSDIYKGIRQQGTLISCQQLIMYKLTMLEQKLQIERGKLKELSSEMIILNKKHYKINAHVEHVKKERRRNADNNIENDVQEMSVYGQKYY